MVDDFEIVLNIFLKREYILNIIIELIFIVMMLIGLK